MLISYVHSFIQDNSLVQLVCHPTRAHSDHILDLLLTNEPDFILCISVGASLYGCDHDAVYFTLLTTLPPEPSRKWRLLKYDDVDLDYLNEVFSCVPWDVIDYDADIDQCWLQWKDLFLSAIYQVIPSVKWSKRKLKHWFSHSTIELIHKKRQLYQAYKLNPTPALHDQYRKLSNVVCKCCRDDTIKHSVSVSADYHSNTKRFWHWINSVKRFRSPIPPLSHAGCDVADDAEKASVLNQYFCSVFTKEHISNLHELKLKVSPATIIDSVTISPDDVLSQLSSLDIAKSCGPDCITPRMLKLTADHVCSSLSKVMNKSVVSGSLPFDWISANIVPIHKCSD